MDGSATRHLLEVQAGVISRAQLHECEVSANEIRRKLRRRELVKVHPGVYVDHTGPLTWIQRAWAATLACAPAALCDESALRAAEGPGRRTYDDDRPLAVAIDHSRRMADPDGVRITRVVDLADQVLWNTSPPRQRPEHATLRLAAAAEREIDAVGHLSNAVGSRLTTGARLAGALATVPRIRRRDFLEAVVADVTDGTCSALEHGYLVNVERPHGLPAAMRQFRESLKGPLYRDALYDELGVIVELDGRMFHSKASQHDADLERDLDAAVTRRTTIRLGWGQAYDRACSTAFKLGALFADRGWDGRPHWCPLCPAELPFAALSGSLAVTR